MSTTQTFNLEGKLLQVFDIKKVTDNFSVRELVLETVDAFHNVNPVKFQLHNTFCESVKGVKVNDLRIGERLKVRFYLTGKPYTNDHGTTYYNALVVCGIEKLDKTPVPADGDDLPF